MKSMNKHITIEKYNRDIDIAEEQCETGDVFSQEEVVEIIKSWGDK